MSVTGTLIYRYVRMALVTLADRLKRVRAEVKRRQLQQKRVSVAGETNHQPPANVKNRSLTMLN